MRALGFALAATTALAVAACGDNRPTTPPDDAAVAIDAAPAIDAAIDAPPGAAPCLDRPSELPRPPTGALPCELLPPGFAP